VTPCSSSPRRSSSRATLFHIARRLPPVDSFFPACLLPQWLRPLRPRPPPHQPIDHRWASRRPTTSSTAGGEQSPPNPETQTRPMGAAATAGANPPLGTTVAPPPLHATAHTSPALPPPPSPSPTTLAQIRFSDSIKSEGGGVARRSLVRDCRTIEFPVKDPCCIQTQI
jgi:hypothetical protein